VYVDNVTIPTSVPVERVVSSDAARTNFVLVDPATDEEYGWRFPQTDDAQ
jgi:hypothetical protein